MFGRVSDGLDYHLVRASMVLIFLLFGYQKWFEYEAQVLIPFIQNGPLISWLYPAFGTRGASWFLGVAEWTTGALLLLGFWDKRLGVLGALGCACRWTGLEGLRRVAELRRGIGCTHGYLCTR